MGGRHPRPVKDNPELSRAVPWESADGQATSHTPRSTPSFTASPGLPRLSARTRDRRPPRKRTVTRMTCRSRGGRTERNAAAPAISPSASLGVPVEAVSSTFHCSECRPVARLAGLWVRALSTRLSDPPEGREQGRTSPAQTGHQPPPFLCQVRLTEKWRHQSVVT